MLFNEPKLLKLYVEQQVNQRFDVSVLFNEPKLLKSPDARPAALMFRGFSALQRAEIAEIIRCCPSSP